MESPIFADRSVRQCIQHMLINCETGGGNSMSRGVGRTGLLFAPLIAVLVLSMRPVSAGQGYGAVTPKNAAESTVLALLDTAFNQRNVEEAFAKYVGPSYRQHNPTVSDGKQAIIDALRQ